MGQGMRGHAHLPGLLRAIDAGHAVLRQQAAPQVVGQYHVFGHQQVQRRVAAAGDQLDPGFRVVIGAMQYERIFDAVIIFGLAAHGIALSRQMAGEAPQGAQPIAVRQLRLRIIQGFRADLRVQYVVAQIFPDLHAFDAGFR